MSNIRRSTYDILDSHHKSSRTAHVVQSFIIALISVNVLAAIISTVPDIFKPYRLLFRSFEIFSTTVFTVEYLLRLWSCVEDERAPNRPSMARIRFVLSPIGLIDLLSILPFYLPIVFHNKNLLFLRATRLFRIFRILKLERYSESARMFIRVSKKRKEELTVAALGIAVLVVCSSGLLFTAEHDAQPQAFSSVPQAMWWSICTITTIGYGDVTPITTLGKFLASIISLLGVAVIAVPTAILSAGFIEELQDRKSEPLICPHCGKEIKR
jgi:voltage-gated potassium channel